MASSDFTIELDKINQRVKYKPSTSTIDDWQYLPIYDVAVQVVKNGIAGHVESQRAVDESLPFYITPDVFQELVFNLTYDENNADESVILNRLHGSETITPNGFELNGYDTRLSLVNLPEYINNSSGFGMQATIGFYNQTLKTLTVSEPVLFLGENASISAKPRYALTVNQDRDSQKFTYLALEYFDTTLKSIPLARSEWRYERDFPRVDDFLYRAKAQALYFIDTDTLVVTAQYNNEESKAFKINLISNEIIGEFTFGAVKNRHVSSMAEDASGNVWVACYLDETLSKIDLEQSFLTGEAVLTSVCDFGILNTFANVEFITISGINYLIAGEYESTGSPRLYLISADKLVDGYTFSITDAYKYLVINRRIQGITVHQGSLYVIRNRDYQSVDAAGHVEVYNNIASLFSSSPNGTIMIPDSSYSAPSRYPEDCKFRPNTDVFWTMTEGFNTTGDYSNWMSIWSSKLDGAIVDNTYTINREGENHEILINGRLAHQFIATPSVNAVALSLGSYPTSVAGMKNGFSIGRVKDVALREVAIGASKYNDYSTGIHEPNNLTVVNVPISYGAPSWTNVIGSIGTKDSIRTGYYFGEGNLQTVAYQRFDITTLTSNSLDNSYAVVSWEQSSYNSNDICSLGIATLEANSPTYGGLVTTPNGLDYWYPRNVSKSIESNAQFIDIVYRSDRSYGTNNDGYVDAISAAIYIK